MFDSQYVICLRNMGVLSHKLINCTHTGKGIAFCLILIPGYKLVSPTPSSPVQQLNSPSTRDRGYFYRVQAQVFRVGTRCYTINITISTWFIIFICYLDCVWHFGAPICKTSKKSWRRCCSIQHVIIYDLIFQMICACTLQY